MYGQAEIGGAVETDGWTHVYKESVLKAGSVKAYLLAATGNGSFDIKGDVTLANFLDSSCHTAATASSIGGKLTCDVFNAVGVSADQPAALHVAGDVTCKQFKGDADGDGRVTAADARFALRTAVKLETPEDW